MKKNEIYKDYYPQYSHKIVLKMQDIWPSVIEYLQFDELNSCLQTCKLFNYLCKVNQQMWKKMVKNNFELDTILESNYYDTYMILKKLENFKKMAELDQYHVAQLYTTKYLHVTYINVTSPHAMPKLPNLVNLNIHNINLPMIPFKISNVHNLTNLQLDHNGLQYLPDEIGELSGLQWLSVNSNLLKSLPPSIGKLYNLMHLSVNRNELLILPSEIGNLRNLERLCAHKNYLIKIPNEILNLQNLKSLDLRHNFIWTYPDLSELRNLNKLSIDEVTFEMHNFVGDNFETIMTYICTFMNKITHICKMLTLLKLIFFNVIDKFNWSFCNLRTYRKLALVLMVPLYFCL